MGEIAVISANLSGFEKPVEHAQQSVDCDFHHFTDENFPPRFNSLSPRLQARIPKMFGWQLKPGYGYYIWVDSSCRLSSEGSIQWFLSKLGDNDFAVFKHPHRDTVQQEADYLKKRLAIGCPYITPRYQNEDIDGQLAEVEPDQELYASTAFIYRNTPKVRQAMKDWWYNTSRFHSIDQLSLPYVLFENGCTVEVIPDNYLKCEALEYVRTKK